MACVCHVHRIELLTMRDKPASNGKPLPPDSPSRIFGVGVMQARLQKLGGGWSQKDLADELQRIGSPIDRPTLQRIEQGTRAKGVTLEEVIEIAAALDVSPVQLFTRPEDPEVERPESVDAEEWPLHRISSGAAGPLMRVTRGNQERDAITQPSQAVRNFFYSPIGGGRALSVGRADPTLYDRFISEPEYRLLKESLSGGFERREGGRVIERIPLPTPLGRRSAKPGPKKRRKKGEQ
jgi:transcriptional regulator with XRE-family HTH domain